MTLRPILAALALASSLVQAADPAPAQPASDMPQGADAWVRYLADFTRNGEMLADPKKFMGALFAVSEPAFVTSALTAAMDPNLYTQSVASLMDPKAYGNFARAMDPAVITAWTQALADPQFFAALQSLLTDPNKMMRWVMLPLDPKLLAAGMNLLNPNVYARWLSAPVNPQVASMAMAPANPGWYAGWGNTLVAPQSYGPTMGTWMRMPNYGMPAAPVMLPMPVMPAPR
ncbi:MAG: hypothetical protein AB1899_15990 [Pseudomonadota bacterium]